MSRLIPAKELKARYSSWLGRLYLEASGEVPYYTTGYFFRQELSIIPPPVFSLRAYNVYGKPLKPYTHPESFPMGDPGDIVIIKTANHPEGVEVPVDHGPSRGTLNSDPFSSPVKQQRFNTTSYKGPDIHQSKPVVIDTIVSGTFSIKEAIPSDPTGSVDIDFDPYRLRLDHASVWKRNIEWKFTASKGGVTVVTVDTAPQIPESGIGFVVIRTTYIVNVVDPAKYITASAGESGKSAIGNFSLALSSGYDEDDLEEEPGQKTYLDVLRDALKIVRGDGPSIRLAELVHCRSEHVYSTLPIHPVTDAVQLEYLTATFRTKEGTAIMTSHKWGEWNPPVFTQEPVGIYADIDLDSIKDITLATEALKRRIKPKNLLRIDLFEVQGEHEPHYYYEMYRGPDWTVGARTLDVSKMPKVRPFPGENPNGLKQIENGTKQTEDGYNGAPKQIEDSYNDAPKRIEAAPPVSVAA